MPADIHFGILVSQKGTYLGELNSQNLAHGRGVDLLTNGTIDIGFRKNGSWIPGNYIRI